MAASPLCLMLLWHLVSLLLLVVVRRAPVELAAVCDGDGGAQAAVTVRGQAGKAGEEVLAAGDGADDDMLATAAGEGREADEESALARQF